MTSSTNEHLYIYYVAINESPRLHKAHAHET